MKLEARVLWAVQQRRENRRGPLYYFAALLARHPLYDFCLITPVCAVLAAIRFGEYFWWTCIFANVVFLFVEASARVRCCGAPPGGTEPRA